MSPIPEGQPGINLPKRPALAGHDVFVDLAHAQCHEKGGGVYQCVHTPDRSYVLWQLPKGSLLPHHHHSEEQVTFLIAGEYRLKVGDQERVNGSGSITFIASNVPHSGQALSDCRVLDIFTPPRPNDFEGVVIDG